MNLSFWNVDNLQRQDRIHYTTPHTYFPLMLSCCVFQLRETHSSLLETRLGAAPGLLSRPPHPRCQFHTSVLSAARVHPGAP